MPLDSSYRTIPLTKGQVTKLDPDEYERFSIFKWYALWNDHIQGFYAVRMTKDTRGKRHMIYLHRAIMGLELYDPRNVDHAFHDGLDNRKFIEGKENLRLASDNENQRNRIRKRKSLTGYKGISKHKKTGRYRANITVNNVLIYLGSRDTAEAAWRELYVPAAKKLHGKFARFE